MDGSERVVGYTLGKLGDGVSRGGRYNEQVGVVSQFNVTGMPVLFLVVEISRDGLPGKSLQGQGGDELLRVIGHNHMNLVTTFGQLAHEIGRFIGGNRSGNTNDDVFSCGLVRHDLKIRPAGRLRNSLRTALRPTSPVPGGRWTIRHPG